MQHLGTCSRQSPELPAVQHQAPRLLHAQMPKVVPTDRPWSLARAAPAQAAFHGRVVQAQPWRGAEGAASSSHTPGCWESPEMGRDQTKHRTATDDYRAGIC